MILWAVVFFVLATLSISVARWGVGKNPRVTYLILLMLGGVTLLLIAFLVDKGAI